MTDQNIKPLTLPFSTLNKASIPIAGGKGANLGEMFNAGIPVPDGFVVTADAYYYFLDKSSLRHKIQTELENLDIQNSESLNRLESKNRLGDKCRGCCVLYKRNVNSS